MTQVDIPGPVASDFEGAVALSGEEFDALLAEAGTDEERAVVESSAIGLRMVQIAESQRGVRESGGEDRGVPWERYVRPFGVGPAPWCAFFVSWCYWQTTTQRPPWSNPGYVPSVYAWAQAAGRLTRAPQRGDMFGTGGAHMGLVSARLRDGQILSIEGNWGDAVMAVRRPISAHWFATP
ncbi:C40 family peptidase [Saccharothrix variisporea]|uniref:CHAP domain-containing protein n=1 Tax=Saccharothrix variisporea TaxID=543527 RepID=A0A495X0I7_9PSEU|nr:hypothetical protein [Saccharothrix variisporea]RKT67641.1 hypothetical protein DFJ66_0817 [Saccharothrix variisporea]